MPVRVPVRVEVPVPVRVEVPVPVRVPVRVEVPVKAPECGCEAPQQQTYQLPQRTYAQPQEMEQPEQDKAARYAARDLQK